MEETVKLREIIEIVLKGKIIIAIFMIISLILAATINWFVLDEKYESVAIVQVTSGVQETGILASYIQAEFTPTIYSQRIQNKPIMKQAFEDAGVKNKYNGKNLKAIVDVDPTKNLIELTYTASAPDKAQHQLQVLMEATKQKMNESVQSTLIDLETTYNSELNSLSNEIELIIEQYNKIIRDNKLPEILILQTVLNNETVLNITKDQTTSLSNINGNLQNKLLQMQAQIQTKSEEYRKILASYQTVKTGLNSFKPDPFIRVIGEPTLEEDPSSPNRVLNLGIGLIFGIMVGLCIVFFRHFWRNSVPLKQN